jgi:hypothetical protein
MSLAKLLFLSSLSLFILVPPAPSLGQDAESFSKLPAPQSCRLIDFDTVKVVPGIVNGTWFLIVSGNKPYVTMRVDLSPRVYIRQPEYWGIEVVGCMNWASSRYALCRRPAAPGRHRDEGHRSDRSHS